MIDQLVTECIDFEKNRGLRPETLKELNRYLQEVATYCQDKLDEICGFAPRTIAFHGRICRWWEAFLVKDLNKPFLSAMPEDLLEWIVYRQNQNI